MEIDESIRANDEGVFRLEASAATLDGPAIRIEHFPGPDGTSVPSIGYWSDPAATASWTVRAAPGDIACMWTMLFEKAMKAGLRILWFPVIPGVSHFGSRQGIRGVHFLFWMPESSNCPQAINPSASPCVLLNCRVKQW